MPSMDKAFLKAVFWGAIAGGAVIGIGAYVIWKLLPDQSSDPLYKKPLSFLQEGTRISREYVSDELGRRYITAPAANLVS